MNGATVITNTTDYDRWFFYVGMIVMAIDTIATVNRNSSVRGHLCSRKSIARTDTNQIIETHPLPPVRQLKRFFIVSNGWQGFVAFDLALGDEVVFFGADFLQEDAGGFVGGVLGDEEAAHCELEDGLFEGVHGFGAVEQHVEVGGDALPVVGQCLGRFALGERAQQGVDELGVLLRFELAAGFECVAELHQFFDAGDDTGLFDEWWQANDCMDNFFAGDIRLCASCTLTDEIWLERFHQQEKI